VEPIASLSLVAFDCPDPQGLARFYAAITGWEIERDDGDWVTLSGGAGVRLAFQLAPDHVAPQWPDPAHPQQAHLDFDVADLAEGERLVLALGAKKADTQPDPHDFTVFIDPAGHPFCLVRANWATTAT
jgi:catechol 2,3-dioxygenase-like lactoylglutathione lyase family enzyme